MGKSRSCKQLERDLTWVGWRSGKMLSILGVLADDIYNGMNRYRHHVDVVNALRLIIHHAEIYRSITIKPKLKTNKAGGLHAGRAPARSHMK